MYILIMDYVSDRRACSGVFKETDVPARRMRLMHAGNSALET